MKMQYKNIYKYCISYRPDNIHIKCFLWTEWSLSKYKSDVSYWCKLQKKIMTNANKHQKDEDHLSKYSHDECFN